VEVEQTNKITITNQIKHGYQKYKHPPWNTNITTRTSIITKSWDAKNRR